MVRWRNTGVKEVRKYSDMQMVNVEGDSSSRWIDIQDYVHYTYCSEMLNVCFLTHLYHSPSCDIYVRSRDSEGTWNIVFRKTVRALRTCTVLYDTKWT